jgi:hypothetical protein
MTGSPPLTRAPYAPPATAPTNAEPAHTPIAPPAKPANMLMAKHFIGLHPERAVMLALIPATKRTEPTVTCCTNRENDNRKRILSYWIGEF